MKTPQRSFARLGFSMVEILITIGILALLAVVLVVALGKIVDANKGRQTKTTLHDLRGMTTEYETTAGASASLKQPPIMYINGSTLSYNPAQPNYDIWKYYEYPVGTPNPQPGNHYYALYGSLANTFGQVSGSVPQRYTNDAVGNTQLVLSMIEQVPAAKTMLSGMPAGNRMEAPPGNIPAPKVLPTRPALALDGWHNPIIFVPSSGLLVSVTLPSGQVGDKLIRSPDKRPFWASAGPDGAFTDPNTSNRKPVGEDNVYSFED